MLNIILVRCPNSVATFHFHPPPGNNMEEAEVSMALVATQPQVPDLAQLEPVFAQVPSVDHVDVRCSFRSFRFFELPT